MRTFENIGKHVSFVNNSVRVLSNQNTHPQNTFITKNAGIRGRNAQFGLQNPRGHQRLRDLVVAAAAAVIVVLVVGCGWGCGCCCCCCCCWQHVRLPPRGVCRFPGWQMRKLEFWHFPLPKFILRFLFSSVFVVFFSKNMPQTAGCTVQKPARLSVSFGVFLSVSPFASVFAVFWPSLDFLHMPASTCIRLSTLCGGLGRGHRGGG